VALGSSDQVITISQPEIPEQKNVTEKSEGGKGSDGQRDSFKSLTIAIPT